MKRILVLLLALSLVLCACGSAAPEQGTETPTALTELEPGFVPSEISYPAWLQGAVGAPYRGAAACMDYAGDRIYLAGYDPEGQPHAGYYNTLEDRWVLLDLDLSGIPGLQLQKLSAADGKLWLLASVYNEQSAGMDWYIFRGSAEEGDPGERSLIGFYGEEPEGEHHNLYSEFINLIALDGERALLFDRARAYLVDGQAQELGRPELNDLAQGNRFRAGDAVYYESWNEEEGDCIRLFDPETLSLGQAIPLNVYGSFSSERGRFLCSQNDGLCAFDPETGEFTLIFRWLDATLSADEDGRMGVLENSAGDFFYAGNGRLIRVSPAMVPAKKALTLAVFGDTGDWFIDMNLSRGNSADVLPDELRDAIVLFNNTDPEYRIELKPCYYATEQERDRFLAELSTQGGADLIDTTMLPEGALDSGVLVDLLPYLDADPELGREDFLPGLLRAMLRDGGLYEYTSRFTLVSLAVARADYPGEGSWSFAAAEALLASPGNRRALPPYLDRDAMTELIVRMAAGEFIDWEKGVCSFDDGRFARLLQWTRDLPYAGGEWSPGQTNALQPAADLSAAVDQLHDNLGGDFCLAGLPEAVGTGSYWIRVDSEGERPGSQRAARAGILASSPNREGAWRFLRCLMRSRGRNDFYNGIPANRAVFEQIVEHMLERQRPAAGQNLSYPGFSAADAAELRRVVYGTDRMVRTDEALLRIIRSEAEAYYAGERTAEEAAAQTQRRAALYVAEQKG